MPEPHSEEELSAVFRALTDLKCIQNKRPPVKMMRRFSFDLLTCESRGEACIGR